MSSIPSISVWSSIKIPIRPVTTNDDKVKPVIPYVDSAVRKQVKTKKKSREMVNLKVPDQTNRPTSSQSEKENSFPRVCPCSDMHKRRTSRTIPNNQKKINLLTVPETSPLPDDHEAGDVMEKSVKPNSPKNGKSHMFNFTNFGDFKHKNEQSFNLNVEKWNLEFDLEEEEDEENDFVPSIKPWSLEELEKINRKYEEMENRIKKITEKKLKDSRGTALKEKNKTKGLKPPDDVFCKKEKKRGSMRSASLESEDFSEYFYESHWSVNTWDLDQDLKGSGKTQQQPRLKPGSPGYYESKLAKLHMIELGLKV